jgi:hypothetical protein
MSRHANVEISDREQHGRHSPEKRDNRRGRNVVEVACRRLASSSYPSLRTLRCDFHEGVLTVRGRVPSYHLTQVREFGDGFASFQRGSDGNSNGDGPPAGKGRCSEDLLS